MSQLFWIILGKLGRISAQGRNRTTADFTRPQKCRDGLGQTWGKGTITSDIKDSKTQ